MYELELYVDERGRCPGREFLNEAQVKVRAKIVKWLEMLEKEGPDLPRPYADAISGKIRELRVSFGSHEYRFLYFFFGKRIVITHGFLKKTQKIPCEEIQRASRCMKRFLLLNKGGNLS